MVLKIEYCISGGRLELSCGQALTCDDFLGHKRLSTEVRIQVGKHLQWLMPPGCLSGQREENFPVDPLRDISGLR